MATVKEINHDSSLVLADFYTDLISNPDGAMAIKASAKLGGSINGLEMDYDAGAQNNNDLRETFTFSDTELRWRFRLDLGGATNNNAGVEIASIGLLTTANSNFMEIAVDANGGDGGFTIDLSYVSDATGVASVGSGAFPSSGDICVDIKAVRETADGNNDGAIELFLNGVSQFSVANAENFNNFSPAKSFLNFRSNNANITGILKYDEFLLTNVASVGLCTSTFSGYDLVLGGGQV